MWEPGLGEGHSLGEASRCDGCTHLSQTATPWGLGVSALFVDHPPGHGSSPTGALPGVNLGDVCLMFSKE